MSIMIYQECDESILGCILSIIISAVSILIMLFSLYCSLQIYLILRKIVFEIVPLSTSFLESLSILILTFFDMNFRFLLIGLYIQTITFALICQSFIVLYFRIKNELTYLTKQKVVRGIFFVILFNLLIGIIMIMIMMMIIIIYIYIKY